jgi:hypothetical protein
LGAGGSGGSGGDALANQHDRANDERLSASLRRDFTGNKKYLNLVNSTKHIYFRNNNIAGTGRHSFIYNVLPTTSAVTLGQSTGEFNQRHDESTI